MFYHIIMVSGAHEWVTGNRDISRRSTILEKHSPVSHFFRDQLSIEPFWSMPSIYEHNHRIFGIIINLDIHKLYYSGVLLYALHEKVHSFRIPIETCSPFSQDYLVEVKRTSVDHFYCNMMYVYIITSSSYNYLLK